MGDLHYLKDPVAVQSSNKIELRQPPPLAPTVTGIGVTMAVITTSFVLTRLYANFRSARKLGWDDCA